jgi:hypothetical protein
VGTGGFEDVGGCGVVAGVGVSVNKIGYHAHTQISMKPKILLRITKSNPIQNEK